MVAELLLEECGLRDKHLVLTSVQELDRGTRYDKLARSFAAMATLACTLRCLRQY